MGNEYDYEPSITPEQEEKSNTLIELSSKYHEMEDTKRNKALMILLDETSNSDVKKKELNTYLAWERRIG